MRKTFARATLAAAALAVAGTGLAAVSGGAGFDGPLEVMSPAAEAAEPLQFVGHTAVARHATTPRVDIPSTVEAGDRLVLMFSLNAATRQVSAPTGGPWELLGDRVAGSMRTLAWTKVAEVADAGARVGVPLDQSAKSTLHVAAYRGADSTGVGVASLVDRTTTRTRVTPWAEATTDSWAVSYWASKSPSTTSWVTEPSVTARGGAANSGSGRIASVLADSAGPVSASSYGGRTATSDAESSSATTWTLVLGADGSTGGGGEGAVVEVAADGETEPVLNSGDAADDPALWVHPTDPARSLVIGNDKQGALEVYDLAGTRRQRLVTGTSFWGNVDVRHQVRVGARTLDLVMAYNAGVRTYTVDPEQQVLEPAGDGTGAVWTGGGEGLCGYVSARTEDAHVFVITRGGRVRQYRLHDGDGDGLVQGSLVREFEVGSEAEGCVADDASGALYVGEEDVGLWRYGAEPGDGSTRVLVDAVRPSGNLAYDVEGVTLADTGGGAGYLIVSAQNGADPEASYFAVYDRRTNAYLSSFRIGGGGAADGCERTDGIAAWAGDLGTSFPRGVFVCQDNGNTSPAPGHQNFKLTRLERVLPLD